MNPLVLAAVAASRPEEWPAPSRTQSVLGPQVASGTSAQAVLPLRPAAGSTLIAIARAHSSLSNLRPITGYTELASGNHGAAGIAWRVAARAATGVEDERTATMTTAASAGNLRMVHQEWANLAPVASLVATAGIVRGDAPGSTAWDPRAATTDTARSAYLCLLAAAASIGSLVTPWTGGVTDDVGSSGSHLQAGHRVVIDGAPLDTSIAWTTPRAFAGAVIPLRGR